jgi:hypothetical protein
MEVDECQDLRERAITDPLGVIDDLFEQRGSNLSNDLHNQKPQDMEYGEKQLYEDMLQDPAFVAKIPYLTRNLVGKVPHNSLVRYRGYVIVRGLYV